MLKRYINRFPHAIRGLVVAAKTDFGFRTQLYGILTVLLTVLYFVRPISSTELLLVVLGYFLILITELQNSALEIALDHLHPGLHDEVGKSKDMASAAVLLAGTFLLVVITSIIFNRL